jgi:hypothetical protein
VGNSVSQEKRLPSGVTEKWNRWSLLESYVRRTDRYVKFLFTYVEVQSTFYNRNSVILRKVNYRIENVCFLKRAFDARSRRTFLL